MPFCANCGQKFDNKANFCPECGKSIAPQTQTFLIENNFPEYGSSNRVSLTRLFQNTIEILVILAAIPLVGYSALEAGAIIGSGTLAISFVILSEIFLILAILREHGKIRIDF